MSTDTSTTIMQCIIDKIATLPGGFFMSTSYDFLLKSLDLRVNVYVDSDRIEGMALILDHDVKDLVTLLKSKKISLYHACQLQDFQSYLKLGGVSSRSLLESSYQDFTKFTSDTTDKTKGVWDKVFFNFNDFGWFFHNNKGNGVPNVYGPISLKFESDVLENASDISITLCSITDKNFDRTVDSLSLDEVGKIFGPRFLKDKEFLKKKFSKKKITNPEINALYSTDLNATKASLDTIVEILVDPIVVNGVSLLDEVKRIANEYNTSLGAMVRIRSTHRSELFKALIECSKSSYKNWEDIVSKPELDNFKLWRDKVIELPPTKGFMLKNYINYLHDGTTDKLVQSRSNKAKEA